MIFYQSRSAFTCVGCRSRDALEAILRQPIFWIACLMALFNGSVAWIYVVLRRSHESLATEDDNVYKAFTGLLGFFLVFRTQQAYSRFQKGCHLLHVMTAEFLDSGCLLMSLSRKADVSHDSLRKFHQLLVRLLSLLHALCLSELSCHEEVTLDNYQSDIIDVLGLDAELLKIVEGSECKPEIVWQQITNLMVDETEQSLKIPPPLLTRAFQELGNGMCKFHEALSLIHIPFPFPFVAVEELLLVIHLFFSAATIGDWSKDQPLRASLMASAQCLILWVLHGLASELDNPYGTDINDLDMAGTQDRFNHRLVSLLKHGTSPTPTMSPVATLDVDLFEECFPHCSVPKGGVSVSNRHMGAPYKGKSLRHLASIEKCLTMRIRQDLDMECVASEAVSSCIRTVGRGKMTAMTVIRNISARSSNPTEECGKNSNSRDGHRRDQDGVEPRKNVLEATEVERGEVDLEVGPSGDASEAARTRDKGPNKVSDIFSRPVQLPKKVLDI